MLLAACRCGPRPQNFSRYIADAKREARFDPTGTLDIRTRFRREMDAAWSKLHRLVLEAVDRNDALGLRGVTSTSLDLVSPFLGYDKVKSFQDWIDAALNQVVLVGGVWTARYIKQAAERAIERANELTDVVGNAAPDRLRALQSLTVVELQGVMEAVSQQAVRAFTAGMFAKQRPSQVARSVAAVVNSVGKIRGRMIVNTMIVKTFSAVTLDSFRSAGVTHVGTTPEKLRDSKSVGDYNPNQIRVPTGHGDPSGEWTTEFGAVSPSNFIAARNQSTRSGFLSTLSPDDLTKHRLLMNGSHTVGVAIDPDGDVQNLFNNGGPKGAAARAIVRAIRDGGRTLDCYDGFLPDYYRQFGFQETGRMKFNPDFAHGWDTAKNGTPDVVFMAWKGYIHGGSKAAIGLSADRAHWIANERSRDYGDDWNAAKARSRKAAKPGGGRDHRSVDSESRAAADGSGNKFSVGTSTLDWRAIADAARKTFQARGEGGRFRPYTKMPSAKKIREIVKAEQERVAALSMVEVLTAGDDFVCQICEDISDDGPYLIDEAEGLIPAHVNCRCAFVPASDERFAEVQKDSASDFNPYHQPAGAPLRKGGQFAEAPGIKAIGIDQTDEVTRNWFAKSNIYSRDDVLAAAEENQRLLAKVGGEIGRMQGAKFIDPGVKKAEGIQKKLDRGKPAAWITDATRGGYSVETPEQAQRIVEAFAQRFPVADETWMETKAAYFDRKLMVKFRNGQVGEIQLWPPGMLAAKEQGGGHRLYDDDVVDKWQAAEKIKKGGPRSLVLQAHMAKLYGGVRSRLPSSWGSVVLGSSGK